MDNMEQKKFEELCGEKTDTIEVVKCKECKYQEKYFHKDKRMKEGGYWLYGCSKNEDPFVSHAVNGYDDEFCSAGVRKTHPERCCEGLYVKYNVRKVDTGELVNNCFVLRPDRDKAAIAALKAYAAATENKQLAEDIRKWIDTIEEIKE